MRRVLIFSHIYFPYLGGAEIALKEVTDRISDLEFVMITGWRNRKLPRYEQIGNIKVYRIGFGFFQLDQYIYPIWALFKALQFAKMQTFHLTWAIMASQAGAAAMLFKLFKPDIPYLLTDQSGDSNWFWQVRTFFWKPIFRLIYTKAEALQVISTYLADRARRLGYQGRIEVIPNGVQIKTFSRGFDLSEKQQLKNDLGITGQKIIISVSRLVYKNGLETLIKACALVDSKLYSSENNRKTIRDDFKLLLIGTGDLERKLKNLTHRLNIGNQVLFLGDIPNNEIPKYLSISDVFIRPSRSEGQGISFLEAMAAGVPIIATPAGGIVDFVENNKTGLLANIDDADDLARKIVLIFSKNSLRKRLTENAKNLVIREYDWDSLSRKVELLLSSLIDKKMTGMDKKAKFKPEIN